MYHEKLSNQIGKEKSLIKIVSRDQRDVITALLENIMKCYCNTHRISVTFTWERNNFMRKINKIRTAYRKIKFIEKERLRIMQAKENIEDDSWLFKKSLDFIKYHS